MRRRRTLTLEPLESRLLLDAGPFPFTIHNGQFLRDGSAVFLNIIGYQPLAPGQAVGDAIRLDRIQDDLCHLSGWQGGSEPLLLRVYAQPTVEHPVRMPKAFYDGVRDLGFWVIRDVYFDSDYTAPDAIAKGKAAIDAVINEVVTVGGLDRIFAWELANEFAANTPQQIATLESFLTEMCGYLKQQVAGLEVSDWVTWASWPPSDPLRTDGNPIVVDCWDFASYNAYAYEPLRMRDHQAGPVTGRPFAGYLAALKAWHDAHRDGLGLPRIPVVLSETGYPDSPTTVPGHELFHPWAPQYKKGTLSGEVVAEALAERYWDARLSGAVAGFSLFEWNDEWHKAGTPGSRDHPEEFFGIIGFDSAGQARAKSQHDTIHELFTTTRAPGLIEALAADDSLLDPSGHTTVQVTLSPDAVGPVHFRWEASRGIIIERGETALFYPAGQDLGPATIAAVLIDGAGQMDAASTTIAIDSAEPPAIELLTLGTTMASGRIDHIDLSHWKLACWIETTGLWVQPFADMTSVYVRPDGYFWTPVHNSHDGSLWVYAVPLEYEPANLPPGQEPPVYLVKAVLAAANDAENDLLPDPWETARFGHTDHGRYDDPDADLANNLEELLAGTHPGVADNDADEDGLPDNWERIYLGTVDYAALDDPDADGLANEVEFGLGLSPARPAVDADRDGLPDHWELRSFDTLARGPADLVAGGRTVLDAYELSRPLAPERVVVDMDARAGGTLNANGPAPKSLGIVGIEAYANPPSTLYAIQVGSDPDTGWLRFVQSGARTDVYADAGQPEWHTAAEWAGKRLRGLAPATSYTFHAMASTAFCGESASVEAGEYTTNKDADVNRSGLATALDYAYAKHDILYGWQIGLNQSWASDVNDSGSVNVSDLAAIRSRILNPTGAAAGAGTAAAPEEAASPVPPSGGAPAAALAAAHSIAAAPLSPDSPGGAVEARKLAILLWAMAGPLSFPSAAASPPGRGEPWTAPQLTYDTLI